jgi:hypothetical protein
MAFRPRRKAKADTRDPIQRMTDEGKTIDEILDHLIAEDHAEQMSDPARRAWLEKNTTDNGETYSVAYIAHLKKLQGKP